MVLRRSAGIPLPVSAISMTACSFWSQRTDDDTTLRRRGLEGVGQQVAVNAIQRVQIAFDVEGPEYQLEVKRQARSLGACEHRLRGVVQRLVDIERIFFQRLRFRQVPQVLEHAFDLLELAFHGSLETLAILEVIEHLDDQLAAVPDVLNRMGDVVDKPDRDAPERRLPLFLTDVFLQFDEPVRHVVERVAELTELVGRCDGDSLVEITRGEGACSRA
jgi:hypothetical protein